MAGLWPANAYYNESCYAPFGYGQLTNEGKLAEFQLGVALRRRYNHLLGPLWTPAVYEAWTTDYARTKMSLALVLGGLFPPTEPVAWHPDIPWQPVPFDYHPLAQDRELQSWACPTTVPLIYADPQNVARLRSYDSLIRTLSENTGRDLDYISALDLFFGMEIQEQLGLPLDNWTRAVYPEPLRSYIVEFYYLETSTVALKKVLAGYLLKKLLADTAAHISDGTGPKIVLYSGHEVNVATVLAALGVYQLQAPPPYASHLVFEVRRVEGVYGLRMFYQDYQGRRPHPLTLPGCQRFCPLEDFVRLTAHIIPQSDQECLGS
ncbi:hypothetical protein HUJ04_000011 [Dendroctonus ponderosae]|nr:hypothetical protein HUJ04_000011 [Dendroctonus ponderosae]